ncbi:hypothetical protein BDQ17DRAFT_1370248, partial [Cyathus striatus]
GRGEGGGVESVRKVREELGRVLDEFRRDVSDERLEGVDYHLMQFAGVVLEMALRCAGNIENDDDEDPVRVIQGVHPIESMDLGMLTQRDPDALPPRNAFEWAGVFTVLLAFLIRHSADMIMGGVVGMVMCGKYISTGPGHGNPYGLAAVFFVCFPFYARLYWAVVGCSYQDEHVITPGSPGVGFTKRFTLVTVGYHIIPPSTTLRKYQRNLLATSSQEPGAIYCSIISSANSHEEHAIQDIVTGLIAVRSKLNRSMFMKSNAIYEFSLRGRWPAQRYQQVLDLQLQLAYSLSNLMSIMEHLEPTWTQAFLRRTRFMDPDFHGDVLSDYTMISSSPRTGDPPPQVTPSPVVHRFLARMHELEVIHKESEEDYGLPRTLTLETLRNEQYMMFYVSVSMAFGIIVGEQYHIHGLGVRAGIDLGSRASVSATMSQFRPPRRAFARS